MQRQTCLYRSAYLKRRESLTDETNTFELVTFGLFAGNGNGNVLRARMIGWYAQLVRHRIPNAPRDRRPQSARTGPERDEDGARRRERDGRARETVVRAGASDNLIGRRLQSSLMTRSARRGQDIASPRPTPPHTAARSTTRRLPRTPDVLRRRVAAAPLFAGRDVAHRAAGGGGERG